MNESINCPSCGRPFKTKSHHRNGSSQKYCSKKCRIQKYHIKDQAIENDIFQFLIKNQTNQKYILTSTIELHFAKTIERQRIRMAIRRLAIYEKIEIIQNGKTLDTFNFKGDAKIKL